MGNAIRDSTAQEDALEEVAKEEFFLHSTIDQRNQMRFYTAERLAASKHEIRLQSALWGASKWAVYTTTLTRTLIGSQSHHLASDVLCHSSIGVMQRACIE
jgi:hypothetical protein